MAQIKSCYNCLMQSTCRKNTGIINLCSEWIAIPAIVEQDVINPQVDYKWAYPKIKETKYGGKHIHWYVCSHCGEEIDYWDNFCRNCGCKIIKEANNNAE